MIDYLANLGWTAIGVVAGIKVLLLGGFLVLGLIALILDSIKKG